MNIQLIKGNFSKEESLDLLSQLIQVKIRFHENKISREHDEADIKMRETRIRQLQQDFHNLKAALLETGQDQCRIEATILCE